MKHLSLIDENNNQIETQSQEPPKPPVRRQKTKPSQPLKQQTDLSDIQLSNCRTVNTPKYETPKKQSSISPPKSTTVIYRNRSNSSAHYDNNNKGNTEYIDKLNQFQ